MGKKNVDILDIDNNTSSPVPVAPSSSKSAQGLFRADAWEAPLKAIGSSRDARTTARFNSDRLIPKETLNDMYVNDGLIRRIVNLVPEEMFRVPGTIENDPTEEYSEGLIAYTLSKLNALEHFKRAKQMARLTGGAILYIGATGAGKPDDELKPELIDEIEFIKVFDLNDIQTWDCVFDTDLTSATFGQILKYSVKVRVGNANYIQYIHASRCIPFFGANVPPMSAYGAILENRYWGVSILQFMYSDIRDFRLSFANTANILNEFVVGKFKFEDLDEILASGNEKALQARIAAIEMSKSVINAVMLGTNEDYIRDSASVAGLADLLDRFMMLVASTTGYPVTKLFGRSASGLNATGEGDQKSYYDMIRSEMVGVKPEIQKFIDIVATWKGIGETDHTYIWGNMYQPTPQEEAEYDRIVGETFRTKTDGYQRLMMDGVLTQEQVYIELGFEDKFGKYVPIELPDVEDPTENDPLEDDIDEGNDTGNDKEGKKDKKPESKNDGLPEEVQLAVSNEERKGIIKFFETLIQRFSRQN